MRAQKSPLCQLTAIFLTLVSTALLIPGISSARDGYRLEVWIDTVYAWPGQPDKAASIFIKNPEDSIWAFVNLLCMNRPDIAEFNSPPEPTFDTVNTLTSGWEHITADVSITPISLYLEATSSSPPSEELLIAPQEGDKPLINLPLNIFNISDTMTERTAEIQFSTLDDLTFNFWDYSGEGVAYYLDTIVDTQYFQCTFWIVPGEICGYWQEVSGPPADSIAIDTIPVLVLDTSQVKITDGLIYVLHPDQCGDVNMDGAVNILDIVGLILYKYQEHPLPGPPEVADTNGDGEIDILDILHLINYKYKEGPAPQCYPE